MKTVLSAAVCLSFFAPFALAQNTTTPNGNAANANTPHANKLQEFLKQADRNGDGKVDVAERAAISKNMEEFLKLQFIANADKNGDGRVDMSERSAAMQSVEKQRFEWMKSLQSQYGTTTAVGAGTSGGLSNGTSTFNSPPTNNRNQNARDQKLQQMQRGQTQTQFGGGAPGFNPAQGLNGQLNPNQGSGQANPNAFGPGGVRPGTGSSFGPNKGKK